MKNICCGNTCGGFPGSIQYVANPSLLGIYANTRVEIVTSCIGDLFISCWSTITIGFFVFDFRTQHHTENQLEENLLYSTFGHTGPFSWDRVGRCILTFVYEYKER